MKKEKKVVKKVVKKVKKTVKKLPGKVRSEQTFAESVILKNGDSALVMRNPKKDEEPTIEIFTSGDPDAPITPVALLNYALAELLSCGNNMLARLLETTVREMAKLHE